MNDYDGEKLQKVLLNLGLTTEDLDKVTQIQVPDEFRGDAGFYTQAMLEHLEEKRQRLLKEVYQAYEDFQEPTSTERIVILEDKHIRKLERMHQKEIERICAQQKQLEEKEEKRVLKEERIQLLNENRRQFYLKRQAQNALQDQQRLKKLSNLDEVRKQQREDMKIKMNIQFRKQEIRQQELSTERELKQQQKEQQLYSKLKQIQCNRQLIQQSMLMRLEQRRQSYDNKIQKIDLIRQVWHQSHQKELLLQRSRTKSYDEYNQQQSRSNIQEELNQKINQASERKQDHLQLIRRKIMQKQIKIDDAVFNQKRMERLSDLKKQQLLQKVSKQDERMDEIRQQQESMKKQRLKLSQFYEKEKNNILKEYMKYEEKQQPQLQGIVYLTPQKQKPQLKTKSIKKQQLQKMKSLPNLINNFQKKMLDKLQTIYCNELVSTLNNSNINEIDDKLKTLYTQQEHTQEKLLKQCNYLFLFS